MDRSSVQSDADSRKSLIKKKKKYVKAVYKEIAY